MNWPKSAILIVVFLLLIPFNVEGTNGENENKEAPVSTQPEENSAQNAAPENIKSPKEGQEEGENVNAEDAPNSPLKSPIDSISGQKSPSGSVSPKELTSPKNPSIPASPTFSHSSLSHSSPTAHSLPKVDHKIEEMPFNHVESPKNSRGKGGNNVEELEPNETIASRGGSNERDKSRPNTLMGNPQEEERVGHSSPMETAKEVEAGVEGENIAPLSPVGSIKSEDGHSSREKHSSGEIERKLLNLAESPKTNKSPENTQSTSPKVQGHGMDKEKEETTSKTSPRRENAEGSHQIEADSHHSPLNSPTHKNPHEDQLTRKGSGSENIPSPESEGLKHSSSSIPNSPNSHKGGKNVDENEGKLSPKGKSLFERRIGGKMELNTKNIERNIFQRPNDGKSPSPPMAEKSEASGSGIHQLAHQIMDPSGLSSSSSSDGNERGHLLNQGVDSDEEFERIGARGGNSSQNGSNGGSQKNTPSDSPRENEMDLEKMRKREEGSEGEIESGGFIKSEHSNPTNKHFEMEEEGSSSAHPHRGNLANPSNPLQSEILDANLRSPVEYPKSKHSSLTSPRNKMTEEIGGENEAINEEPIEGKVYGKVESEPSSPFASGIGQTEREIGGNLPYEKQAGSANLSEFARNGSGDIEEVAEGENSPQKSPNPVLSWHSSQKSFGNHSTHHSGPIHGEKLQKYGSKQEEEILEKTMSGREFDKRNEGGDDFGPISGKQIAFGNEQEYSLDEMQIEPPNYDENWSRVWEKVKKEPKENASPKSSDDGSKKFHKSGKRKEKQVSGILEEERDSLKKKHSNGSGGSFDEEGSEGSQRLDKKHSKSELLEKDGSGKLGEEAKMILGGKMHAEELTTSPGKRMEMERPEYHKLKKTHSGSSHGSQVEGRAIIVENQGSPEKIKKEHSFGSSKGSGGSGIGGGSQNIELTKNINQNESLGKTQSKANSYSSTKGESGSSPARHHKLEKSHSNASTNSKGSEKFGEEIEGGIPLKREHSRGPSKGKIWETNSPVELESIWHESPKKQEEGVEMDGVEIGGEFGRENELDKKKNEERSIHKNQLNESSHYGSEGSKLPSRSSSSDSERNKMEKIGREQIKQGELMGEMDNPKSEGSIKSHNSQQFEEEERDLDGEESEGIGKVGENELEREIGERGSGDLRGKSEDYVPTIKRQEDEEMPTLMEDSPLRNEGQGPFHSMDETGQGYENAFVPKTNEEQKNESRLESPKGKGIDSFGDSMGELWGSSDGNGGELAKLNIPPQMNRPEMHESPEGGSGHGESHSGHHSPPLERETHLHKGEMPQKETAGWPLMLNTMPGPKDGYSVGSEGETENKTHPGKIEGKMKEEGESQAKLGHSKAKGHSSRSLGEHLNLNDHGNRRTDEFHGRDESPARSHKSGIFEAESPSRALLAPNSGNARIQPKFMNLVRQASSNFINSHFIRKITQNRQIQTVGGWVREEGRRVSKLVAPIARKATNLSKGVIQRIKSLQLVRKDGKPSRKSLLGKEQSKTGKKNQHGKKEGKEEGEGDV